MEKNKELDDKNKELNVEINNLGNRNKELDGKNKILNDEINNLKIYNDKIKLELQGYNNIKLEYEKIKIEKEELNKEITRLKENVKKYY